MTAVRCVHPGADLLGETPVWCPRTRAIWWIDIERPTLQRFDPATGRHEAHPIRARFLGSLALRRAGGFLLALDRALFTYDPERQALAPFCTVEPDDRDTRLNDGRCDGAGRFWVGTMDNGLAAPTGSFYRVDPDGTAHRAFGDVIVTNSVAVSPDQRTLYMSDTRRFVIWAFDLAADGTLSGRRVFADHTATGDRPDGACCDAEGYLWNAIFAGGRIVRHAPDGRIERSVPLPVTNPTCVGFGGDRLETLYVTTARKFLTPAQLAAEPLAGALLAFEPGVRGLPEPMFAG
ncbi:MAG: SMP-30/gluconolactonase/LRE family protein [Alphaproteobacteria bacterium]